MFAWRPLKFEAWRNSTIWFPDFQMNQITHWMDASQIYGSSDTENQELRESSGGLLKMSRVAGTQLGILPTCTAARSNLISMCSGCSKCFFAGHFSIRLNHVLDTTKYKRSFYICSVKLPQIVKPWITRKHCINVKYHFCFNIYLLHFLKQETAEPTSTWISCPCTRCGSENTTGLQGKIYFQSEFRSYLLQGVSVWSQENYNKVDDS